MKNAEGWHAKGVTDEGRDAPSILVVGAAACPARLSSIRRNRRGVRLPLEGKLAAVPRLRKRQAATTDEVDRRRFSNPSIGNITAYHLIRHGLRRATFPSRGRLLRHSIP